MPRVSPIPTHKETLQEGTPAVSQSSTILQPPAMNPPPTTPPSSSPQALAIVTYPISQIPPKSPPCGGRLRAVLHQGLEQDHTGPLGSAGGAWIPTGFQQPPSPTQTQTYPTGPSKGPNTDYGGRNPVTGGETGNSSPDTPPPPPPPPFLQGFTAVCLWYRRRTGAGGP